MRRCSREQPSSLSGRPLDLVHLINYHKVVVIDVGDKPTPFLFTYAANKLTPQLMIGIPWRHPSMFSFRTTAGRLKNKRDASHLPPGDISALLLYK